MNANLKYLITSNSIFVFADSLIIPIYAIFITSLGGGLELAGILFSLKFVANTLTQLVLHKFKDKTSFSILLLKLNYFLRGSAWLSLVFFQSIPLLIIVQTVVGISEGLGNPAFNSLLADNLDDHKHMKDWTVFGVVTNLSVALGAVLSGFIIASLGFQFLFFAMAFFSYLALIVFHFHKKILKPIVAS